MTGVLQNIRYAGRQLRNRPGFAAVAVVTLTLGIGANTALFSVVNGVLIRRLPYPRPQELVALSESKPNFEYGSISYPNFRDWQTENRTFSAMAIYRSTAFSLTGSGEPVQVSGEFVSSELFPILGVRPVMGRTFVPGEDEVGAVPVALISAGLWQRKFSSSRDIVGKNVTLDGKDFTIVGVIPSTFRFTAPSFPEQREVFLPIGQWGNPFLQKRGAGLGIHGIGRLKSGLTIKQARADMARVTANLAAAFPGSNKGIGASLVPLKQQMVGEVRPLLLVLLAAVGCVLLIACANVANLLLARSAGRAREFAIRAALGVSRGQIIRQLLTESVLLAVIGGAFGLLVAAWATRAALGVLPNALPRAEEIGVDTNVLAFTTVLSLGAGILFGLTPAFKIWYGTAQEALQAGGRGGSGTRHRSQSIFVVAEMALALMLLAGAGLLTRTLVLLWHVDPGFDPHHVLNFGVSLPPSMKFVSPDRVRSAFRELDRQMAAIPGIEAVSQTWESLPLAGDDENLFWLEGHPKPATDNEMNWAIDYVVGPDYLKVMHLPLRRGRFIMPEDNEHSPRVTVIDDVFAAKYFPDQDPIGRRIHLNGSDQLTEIVGVVGHVKQWGLDADDTNSLRAEFYVPWMQMPDQYVVGAASGAGMVVRASGTEAGLLDAIRRTSHQMSNQQVIYGMQTMDELIAESLSSQRFSMILLAVFASVALALASVGIYGVISYVVGRRTQEIALRIALGAARADILRLVLRTSSNLAIAGVALGLIGALALTRLMKPLLYGVTATDPLTLAGVSIVVIFVALLASYIPARRAAKVDPMVALRYE
jgi:putative ABC transport system permease protein